MMLAFIAYIIYMLTIIVIILESVAVLFIGIFARGTDTSIITQTNGSTNKTLVLNSLTLMFAFTLIYSPFRKLSIFTLISLLMILSISAQTNIVFGTFWDSCFNGFSYSFQMTGLIIIRSVFASFATLLTILDMTGLFDYWQVYLIIPPIMTVGYSLCSAIVTYGLKTFDGGGGYCIFLYSGVCSLMIWVLCIRGKIDKNRYKIKQSYVNQTLSLIGIIIAFFVWPKFNMAGAMVSSVQSTATSTSLSNSALPNTYLGLSAAIVLSILFASKQTRQQRLKYKVYVDGFVNGGIVIASYQDIVLNPTACLLISSITTIITIIIHKYFLTESETEAEGTFKQLMKNYSKIVYRIAFTFIGSIVASIVVATRNGTTLLLTNYQRIAGFQIVAWIVVASIAVVFGFIMAFCINVFVNLKKNEFSPLEEQAFRIAADDVNFFEGVVNEEMYPLYYDIFEQVEDKQKQKINMAQYTTNAIKKSLLVAANDSPLKQMSIVKNDNRPDNLYDMTRIIHKKDLDSSSNRKGKKQPQDMQVFQNKMAQMSDDEQDGQRSPVKRLSRKEDSLGKQSGQNKSRKERKPEMSQSQAIKQQSMVRTEVRR